MSLLSASLLPILDMLEIGWIQQKSLEFPTVLRFFEHFPGLLSYISSMCDDRHVFHSSTNNDQRTMHAFGFEFLVRGMDKAVLSFLASGEREHGRKWILR